MPDVPDAFQLLMDDHREVERLFEKFEQDNDRSVAIKICEELTLHAMVEEELIYPLYRSKVDPAGADEARQEHQDAKDIITRVEAAEGDQLKSLVQTLKEAVQHHVEEEESELFPKMQAAIPDNVGHLGNDIVARKAELLIGMEGDIELGLLPSTMGQKPVAAPPD